MHTDNLGSIQAITDENKSIISSYYYTPWGGRVLLSGANITDRGYTFHEHLTEFGLVNMNGRMYDPVLARFLSPDPYVQAPDYTQNFNRYSYCLNNPFKYTDPSGEIVWFVPVIIGAVIGAYSGYKAAEANGAKGWNMFGYIAGGALIGGVSGYAGFAAAGAISTAVGGVGGSVLGAAVGGAAAGAINGGGFAAMSGSNVMNGMFLGAASGFVAGGIAGGLAAIAPSFTQANLLLRYSTKALYAGMTGAAAAGGAMFTSDLLNDGQINTSGKSYLQGMTFGAALSMGVSLASSAYDYATWDHYTDNVKAAMLTQKYGYRFKVDNSVSQDYTKERLSQLDVDADMSQCQNYIRIRSAALATKSMAYSIGSHEMVHVADFNANLQTMKYTNVKQWQTYTEQNAVRFQLINANRGYSINGNFWNATRDYGVINFHLQNVPNTYNINQLLLNIW